jgi:hypothetical protein
MSQSAGRVLRSAAQRTSTARIFGNPASTTPARLRTRDPLRATAGFHSVPAVCAKHNNSNSNSNSNSTQTTAEQKNQADQSIAAAAGSYARTDDSITVEYPPDSQLPSSKPVAGAGRAGANVFPTLATFSLQGKVGVVTGGARGLGLVMGRKYSVLLQYISP